MLGDVNGINNSMTYIVDPKVVNNTPIVDTTKGQLIMGTDTNRDFAAFAKIMGISVDSLKVNSDEIEHQLKEIVRWLKLINFHLMQGSDLTMAPEDTEGLY